MTLASPFIAGMSYLVEQACRLCRAGAQGNRQFARGGANSGQGAGALVGHHVVGIVQALAALRLAPHGAVQRLGVAPRVAAGGLAQVFSRMALQMQIYMARPGFRS
jgi:hypothetical protein